MTSTPTISTTPATASSSPHQTAAGSRTPEIRAASAVQIGVVVTSATEAATVVIDRLGSQAAKCAARNSPATTELRRSRGPQPGQGRPLAGEQHRQQRGRAGGVAPERQRQHRRGHHRGQRRGQRDADDGEREQADVPPARAVQRPRLGRAASTHAGTRMRPLAIGTTAPCTVADTAAPPDAVTVQDSTDGRPIFSPCRTT